jgi:hypothetical protein
MGRRILLAVRASVPDALLLLRASLPDALLLLGAGALGGFLVLASLNDDRAPKWAIAGIVLALTSRAATAVTSRATSRQVTLGPWAPDVAKISKGDTVRFADDYEDGTRIVVTGIADLDDDGVWIGDFFLGIHVDEWEPLASRTVEILEKAVAP